MLIIHKENGIITIFEKNNINMDNLSHLPGSKRNIIQQI